MHYRVYLRTAKSDRWWPIKLGANPKQFAMHSDAVEAELQAKESKYFNGSPIVDTMIMTVDQVIFKTEDSEHVVTLLELC